MNEQISRKSIRTCKYVIYGLGLTILNALYTSKGSAKVRRSNRWLRTIWKISPARICSLACITASWYSSLVMVDLLKDGPKRLVCNFIEPAASLGLQVTIKIRKLITIKPDIWISIFKTESESLTALYHALLTLKLLIYSSHHHRPPQQKKTDPTWPSVSHTLSERKVHEYIIIQHLINRIMNFK